MSDYYFVYDVELTLPSSHTMIIRRIWPEGQKLLCVERLDGVSDWSQKNHAYLVVGKIYTVGKVGHLRKYPSVEALYVELKEFRDKVLSGGLFSVFNSSIFREWEDV
jgi:hypothetical protein